MKSFLFWASHVYWPVALACLYLIWTRKGALRWIAVGILFGTSILAYARFIEPRILTVKHADIILSDADLGSPSIRIALFSDTHFGIYQNAMSMRRLVARIQKEKPHAVFIAGDFLYHLPTDHIPEALAPLSKLNIPVFAVLGNHDVGFPGPIYTADLYQALTRLNVSLVENRALEIRLNDHDVIVSGTSDLWQRKQDYGFSSTLPDKPVLLLTHNPDTALHVPDQFDYDLMLAGHTHGGQIRLPGLIHSVIPTQYPFDKGLHVYSTDEDDRLIYITPGTGMVGLPLRFNMPPRIDLLTIYLPKPDT